MGVNIVYGVILVISCVFCALIVIDRALFSQKLRQIESGMTGKEIQDQTGLMIKILKIEGSAYYAMVSSKLTIFKMRLVFINGRLISKQRF